MTRNPSPEVTSLQATIEEYLDWHALRGSSKRHRQDVRRMLLAFATSTGGEPPLEQVTREHCAVFLRSIQERDCKPNTIKAYHRVMDAIFHWCIEDERLEISPMKPVPKPKPVQEQIKPLTVEELAALLAAANRKTFTGLRDAALMGLLADTGLRVTEALSIRFCDIDTCVRSIAVVGKGEKPRTVFNGETAAELLRGYLRRRGKAQPEDILFVSSLGEPIWHFAISARMRRYGERAGIKGKRVSPHTLRHTFAINWLMKGGDTLSLQRILGHATPAMTTRYTNFATADLAELHRSVSPLDRMRANGGQGRLVQPERRKRLR
jgi:integrase/recombinase XerD